MKISVSDNMNQVLKAMHEYSSEVINKAVPRALNRTAAMATTEASKFLRADGYAASSSEIREAIKVIKASGTYGRSVSIRVKRKTVSLINFSARQEKAGVSVKVHGPRKTIKGAFIAQRRGGRYGVFVENKSGGKVVLRHVVAFETSKRGKEKVNFISRRNRRDIREGWKAYKVKELFGPSVGGSFSNPKLQAHLDEFIPAKFKARLVHEIKFLNR